MAQQKSGSKATQTAAPAPSDKPDAAPVAVEPVESQAPEADPPATEVSPESAQNPATEPTSAPAVEQAPSPPESFPPLPPSSPSPHDGDVSAFDTSDLNTVTITVAGEVQSKLLWGCNRGDIGKFVHALRDGELAEPDQILDAAESAGIGCRKCRLLLTTGSRFGCETVEPAEADLARLGFRDAEAQPFCPRHRGKSLTIDMTGESRHLRKAVG